MTKSTNTIQNISTNIRNQAMVQNFSKLLIGEDYSISFRWVTFAVFIIFLSVVMIPATFYIARVIKPTSRTVADVIPTVIIGGLVVGTIIAAIIQSYNNYGYLVSSAFVLTVPIAGILLRIFGEFLGGVESDIPLHTFIFYLLGLGLVAGFLSFVVGIVARAFVAQ